LVCWVKPQANSKIPKKLKKQSYHVFLPFPIMKCYPTTNFKLDLSKLSQTLSPSLPTRPGTGETLIEQSGPNGKVEGKVHTVLEG
jgi:hypothetical protein